MPTTRALKAATAVTPRKYRRIAIITLRVIRVASSTGRPRWPSTHFLILKPSLSRKNTVKQVNVRKKITDVRLRIPSRAPGGTCARRLRPRS